MKHQRGNRAIVALTVEGFLSRLSFGLVNLAMPLYALQLKIDIKVIGIITSVNILIQLVLKPIMGAVTDRLGARRSLLWAICLRSIVPLAFIVARLPWQLFVIRLFYGFTQAWRDPALNALIADAGGKKKVATAFAWYHTAKNTASSLGRAAAGVLLSVTAANYPLVFAVGFALSILPLVAVLRGLPPGVGQTAMSTANRVSVGDDDDLPMPSLDPRKMRRRVLGFSGLGFLFGLTAGMLGLFPVIATQYFHMTPAEIGLVMLASTAVILVSGPVFGWLADNVNRNVVLMVRAVANTCSSLVFLLVHAPALVGVGRAMDDVGKAAFRPAWGSIMAEVSAFDRSKRARTMSLIDVGEDAGDATGLILAGWLLVAGGLPLMLITRIGLAVITEFATFFMTHTSPVASPSRNPRWSRRPSKVFAVGTEPWAGLVATMLAPASSPWPPPHASELHAYQPAQAWVVAARAERHSAAEAVSVG